MKLSTSALAIGLAATLSAATPSPDYFDGPSGKSSPSGRFCKASTTVINTVTATVATTVTVTASASSIAECACGSSSPVVASSSSAPATYLSISSISGSSTVSIISCPPTSTMTGSVTLITLTNTKTATATPLTYADSASVASIISTIGSGTQVFPTSIVSLGPSMIHRGPAPTYTADRANVTAPNCGLPHGNNTCNTAADRSKWCYGMDIHTDAHTTWPNTGRVCSFDFNFVNTTIDRDGEPRLALAVNGQIPGPAIECNWGDIVQVKVTNSMPDNGTSLHFHGVRQLGTNPSDGAAGVTECALAPGDSRIYQWQAVTYGSSWYHSHFSSQSGDGVQGPIIIHGPVSDNYDVDMGTVMVSDLFENTAFAEYSIIAHNGPQNATNYLLNGKNTKPDLSAGQHQLWEIESGKKYLFRMVNSAAQNMWKLHIDHHKMTVIASDNTPIVPYTTDWLSIGIGQRYDVIIEADQPATSYHFRAVTQLACPSLTTNTGLGNANGIIRYKGTPDILPSSTAGNVTLESFATCEDEPLASLVPVVSKTVDQAGFAAQASSLPVGAPNVVSTTDDGAVFRWYLAGNSMDVDWANPTLQHLAQNQNLAVAENSLILDGSKRWVYFVIQNQFFAAHPMHLHGHDFALLGMGLGTFDASSMIGQLNFASPARRDTAMLQGQGWTVIAFETDNPGAWLMHCHIIWHVDGGLSLQFVERPSDMPLKKWVDDGFETECKNWNDYVDRSPAYPRLREDSGLKRRVEKESWVA